MLDGRAAGTQADSGGGRAHVALCAVSEQPGQMQQEEQLTRGCALVLALSMSCRQSSGTGCQDGKSYVKLTYSALTQSKSFLYRSLYTYHDS